MTCTLRPCGVRPDEDIHAEFVGGAIQVADCPGRHEPGTGEIRFQKLFPAIEYRAMKGTSD